MDEQGDSNDDGDKGNDPPRDERDLDVRRRTLLTVRGDLFQARCLRAWMTNEALNLGLDQLAGLEFV